MIKQSLLAAAMLVTTSTAIAEISANATLTSDYVFRGVSQTDNQLAIQGGFDYAWDNGFYVGTWASNVSSDFFNGAGNDPQTEVDLYGGYSGEYSGIGYDLGYLRYEYPGFGAADTNEVYVSASYMGFGVSLNYSDELAFLPSTESAWYAAASYDFELPYEIGLSFHVGHSFGDAFDVGISDLATSSKIAGLSDSYTDWSIGLSKSWMGADYALTYSDLSDLEAIGGSGTLLDPYVKGKCNENFCDSKIVASISKSF